MRRPSQTDLLNISWISSKRHLPPATTTDRYSWSKANQPRHCLNSSEATLTRGEADWHNERKIAIRNIGWRWRKWCRSPDQVECFGVENG